MWLTVRLYLLCGLLAILIPVSGILAQTAGKSSIDFNPRFEFSRTSSEPIIEYNLIQHLLAEPDPEPLLRVYGDGRVLMHFPSYMRRAGDYELRLSRPELMALLRSLAADGIIDFDPAAVRQNKRQLEAQQLTAGEELYTQSDVTETVIDIRLDGYQRGPTSTRIVNLNRRFNWRNLEHDARRFPQSEALRGAAAGVGRLHGLLRRSDLQPLP